jgi:hypothetical protein
MAQNKILLDSNSYFRLAKSIHPLLFEPFGEEDHCLYVLSEMEKEWNRSTRLQTKFAWVDEEEYRDNRDKNLTLSKSGKAQLATVTEFIWQEIQANYPGPSKIDTVHLAYGYILGIPVVTDDQDMIPVAQAFGIQSMSSLRLLDLMLQEGHIDIDKVRQIASYWLYEGDTPAKFRKEFESLFNEPPPVA